MEQSSSSSRLRTTSLGRVSPQPLPRGGGALPLSASDPSLGLEKKHKDKKLGQQPSRDYGVGTLIVRIVAAKDLPPAIPGSFFFAGSSNPYCVFDFEGQVAFTSVVTGSLDPIWPREQYFFEVKMPAAHADSDEAASASMKEVSKSVFSAAEPHLQVKVIHRANAGNVDIAQPPVVDDPSVVVKPKANAIPPGDKLIGEAFVNVVDLATARVKSIDGWFPLSAGGSVKLVVEYDVVDPVPTPGEMVRLLGFGSPADLWPLPIKEEFVVEGYSTNEGWKCIAEVHRFHVISAGRHKSIIRDYQNRFLDAAIEFMETPLMGYVNAALDKAEVEGFTVIKEEAWEGLKQGASRWWNGGFSVALSDVNFLLGRSQAKTPSSAPAATPAIEANGGTKVEEDYIYDYIPQEVLDQIMCPITGTPMKDPVVAADGHTYEREAIERWLEEHDTSPLTGAKMNTTMTFRNYSLLTTIEELRQRNEEGRARHLENPEEKKCESKDSAAGIKKIAEEKKAHMEVAHPPLDTKTVEVRASDELPVPPEAVEAKPTAPQASPATATVKEAAEKVAVTPAVETTPSPQAVEEAQTAPPATPDDVDAADTPSTETEPLADLKREESSNEMKSGSKSRRKKNKRASSYRF